MTSICVLNFCHNFTWSWQKFLEKDVLVEGLSSETPIYVVSEGHEPPFFTCFFEWDSSKANVRTFPLSNMVLVFFSSTRFYKYLLASGSILLKFFREIELTQHMQIKCVQCLSYKKCVYLFKDTYSRANFYTVWGLFCLSAALHVTQQTCSVKAERDTYFLLGTSQELGHGYPRLPFNIVKIGYFNALCRLSILPKFMKENGNI